jgi:hypothetical protein
MDLAPASTRVYPLDRLHLGVRVLTLAGWLVAWGALTALGLTLAGAALGNVPVWLWLIWIVLSMFLTQWPSRWLEGWLAARWPSGKRLTIDGPRWTVHDKAERHAVDVSTSPRIQLWRFEIKHDRGASQRKGHVVLALRLSQAGTSFVLYAVAAPEVAAQLQVEHPFFDLRQKPDPAPAAVAQHRSHLAAEAERYNRGHEMTADDFLAVVRQLPNL